ncbi:MAG: haloacid dehalogenase-like hydrolase [Clostridia bacterium]|nr:haloacid dehalogenase-like hydrolase [Clostridia bacterium]
MNVYDFDDTILEGDTERYFWAWVFKKFPHIAGYHSEYLFYMTLQNMGLITRDDSRPHAYAFLKEFDDIDAVVEQFWDEHEHFIKEWYLKTQRKDDVIISASPEFLLIPICKRLGINHLIASHMDKKTGRLPDKFNYAGQKVIRFREVFGDVKPECFFSDSESDRFMAEISEKAIKVIGNELIPWQISK